MPKYVTRPLLLVLEHLLGTYRAGEPTWGFRISSATGLKAGTVYPLLLRLETDGLVESEWEAADDDARRSKRRLYSLTAQGAAYATGVLADASARDHARRAPRPRFA